MNRRENSYLEKYKYAAQIQGRLTTSQPAVVAHLEALLIKSKARFDELDHAYAADGVTIRKKVQSEQGVSADYKLKMKTSTAAATLATWNAAMDGAGNVVGQVLTTEVKDPAGAVLQKHEMVDAASIPRLRQADGSCSASPTRAKRIGKEMVSCALHWGGVSTFSASGK